MAEQKFPSEVIDLPSEGKLYPKGHPLKDGKIEIKYMTAKEEDILTSQNLIKKGVVLDMLFESIIADKTINPDEPPNIVAIFLWGMLEKLIAVAFQLSIQLSL